MHGCYKFIPVLLLKNLGAAADTVGQGWDWLVQTLLVIQQSTFPCMHFSSTSLQIFIANEGPLFKSISWQGTL